MALTTTQRLYSIPSAALGVSVTPSATAWAYSSWVQLTASASTDMVLSGFSLNGSAWTNADFEIEFGVGSSGSETTVARLRATVSTAAIHNSFTFPVPMNVVSAGDRVTVRVRASVGNATAVRVALAYYDGTTYDSTHVTRNVVEVFPNTGANGATVTPTNVSWGNSAWVQLTASTPRDLYLTGLQFVPGGTAGVDFELDIGTGPSGSETVIHTIRGRYDSAAGWIQNSFPMPVYVAMGTRVAARIRKGNAVTTVWRVSAPYISVAQVTQRKHTTSTFLFSYKQFRSHTTSVFKTSATTTTTYNFRETASSDDAYEVIGGTTSLTDTSINIIGANIVGVRFPNITIPQGATIANSLVSFTNQSGSSSSGTGFPIITMKAEASDNAATFAATTSNIGSRPRTTASVTPPDPASYEASPPNVTSLVQEVINRGGWSSGNALAILWIGNGASDTRRVTFNTVDSTTSYGQANLLISMVVPNARTLARPHTTDTFRRVGVYFYTRTHTTSVSKSSLPPTVSVTTPANGYLHTALNAPAFTVQATYGGSGWMKYQAQIDNNSDFSSPVITSDSMLYDSANRRWTRTDTGTEIGYAPKTTSMLYAPSDTNSDYRLDGHTGLIGGTGWTNMANAVDGNLTTTPANLQAPNTGWFVVEGFNTISGSEPLGSSASLTIYYGWANGAYRTGTAKLTAASLPNGVFTWDILRELEVSINGGSWGGTLSAAWASTSVSYVGTNVMASIASNGELENDNVGIVGSLQIYGIALNAEVPKPLSPGTYYYRFRAADADLSGPYGAWSTTRSFNVVNRTTKAHSTSVSKKLPPNGTVSLYFDGHLGISDPQNAWGYDADAFDGSETTYAYRTSYSTGSIDTYYLLGKGTTADPDLTSTISLVRWRSIVYCPEGEAGANHAITTENKGEVLATSTIYYSGGPTWSPYVTVPTPTGGWTWDKLSKLEFRAWSNSGSPNGHAVHKSEIEVTYTGVVTVNKTHTTNTFKRGAYTRSHSTSVFIRDTRNYSRQDVATVPTNSNDLAIPFTNAELDTVATNNGTYVDLPGFNNLVFQFKKETDTNVNAVNAVWNGKTTIPPSERPVYLQIWNYNTATWETLASNNTAPVDTDFTLVGYKNLNLSNYYSAGNVATVRVYQ